MFYITHESDYCMFADYYSRAMGVAVEKPESVSAAQTVLRERLCHQVDPPRIHALTSERR